MKSIASVTILAIFLATMIFTMPAIGDDTKAIETRAKLEALIDRYILSCGAKSELLNSRSDTQSISKMHPACHNVRTSLSDTTRKRRKDVRRVQPHP